MPNQKGELTREEMEQAIEQGGSVLHYGHLYTHRDHIPTEAELAKNDPDRARAEKDRLELQIRGLQDQIRMIDGTLHPTDDPRLALNPVEVQERTKGRTSTDTPPGGAVVDLSAGQNQTDPNAATGDTGGKPADDPGAATGTKNKS